MPLLLFNLDSRIIGHFGDLAVYPSVDLFCDLPDDPFGHLLFGSFSGLRVECLAEPSVDCPVDFLVTVL